LEHVLEHCLAARRCFGFFFLIKYLQRKVSKVEPLFRKMFQVFHENMPSLYARSGKAVGRREGEAPNEG
jgi:hypothetical protein